MGGPNVYTESVDLSTLTATVVFDGNNCAPIGPFFASNGAEKFYTVTLAPGESVTMTTSGVDTVPVIISDCAATMSMCLDGADDGGFATPETVSYTNSSMVTESVILVADTFSATSGTMDVTITVQ